MLKDRIITIDDVRALHPPNDPALYVSIDWQGTIGDIMGIDIVSLAGRLWCMSQFFNEANHRQYVMDCIFQAASDHGVNTQFFTEKYSQFLSGGDVLPAIDAELQVATGNETFVYIRLLWALHWALQPWDYLNHCHRAIRDVVECYSADIEIGWDMCKIKLLAILDTHP